MSSQHTVSIVMPVYNRGRYVSAAIESVLKQTYQNFELIIVDDGSDDDTADKVKSYLDDERVRYVFQQNSGSPSIARNRGIDLSKGEWVAFLDSDDRWYRDKLERQLALVEQCKHEAEPIDLVLGDYSVVDDDKPFVSSFFDEYCVWKLLKLENKHQHQHQHQLGYRFDRSCFLSALLQQGFAKTQSALVRRFSLLEAGCFNHRYLYAEDTDLWLTIAERGNVGIVTVPVFEYHLHGEAMTSGVNERFYLDTLAVLTKHREYALTVGMKVTKLNQRMVTYRLGYAKLLICEKQYRHALAEVFVSIPYLFTRNNGRELFLLLKQLAKLFSLKNA